MLHLPADDPTLVMNACYGCQGMTTVQVRGAIALKHTKLIAQTTSVPKFSLVDSIQA